MSLKNKPRKLDASEVCGFWVEAVVYRCLFKITYPISNIPYKLTRLTKMQLCWFISPTGENRTITFRHPQFGYIH